MKYTMLVIQKINTKKNDKRIMHNNDNTNNKQLYILNAHLFLSLSLSRTHTDTDTKHTHFFCYCCRQLHIYEGKKDVTNI